MPRYLVCGGGCAQGAISRQEFIEALTRSTVKSSSPALALTVEQAEMLFADVDVDRSGTIDIDEFASTWEEMDGAYGMRRMLAQSPVRAKPSLVSAAAGSVAARLAKPIGEANR